MPVAAAWMHLVQIARVRDRDQVLNRPLRVVMLTFNWVESGGSEGPVMAENSSQFL